MNGAALALGAVGALAVGAAVGRRGSRSKAKTMGWTREPVILLQEQVQPGLWVRVQRMDYPDGRQLAAFVLDDPEADTSTQDEEDEAIRGHALAYVSQSTYDSFASTCAKALEDLVERDVVSGLYIVGNTALDDRLQRRGLGMAMYDALIRAAWIDRYALSPHWCARRGHTSADAMRVWSKLTQRYPHVGDPDYMRAEEDDHDPVALAQAGTPPIVWAGTGSPNRTHTIRWKDLPDDVREDAFVGQALAQHSLHPTPTTTLPIELRSMDTLWPQVRQAWPGHDTRAGLPVNLEHEHHWDDRGPAAVVMLRRLLEKVFPEGPRTSPETIWARWMTEDRSARWSEWEDDDTWSASSAPQLLSLGVPFKGMLLPPIFVDDEGIVDGRHRLFAARLVRLPVVPVVDLSALGRAGSRSTRKASVDPRPSRR